MKKLKVSETVLCDLVISEDKSTKFGWLAEKVECIKLRVAARSVTTLELKFTKKYFCLVLTCGNKGVFETVDEWSENVPYILVKILPLSSYLIATDT